MRGAVLHGAHDVRVEEREDPQILKLTDAIIKVSAACVCGSDMWPWRGIDKAPGPMPMGHEYVGVVEEIGADVKNVKVGDFVVVGDGAVGLSAILAAKQLGAERIIAMSRHESRQKRAREFGATDIVEERGDEGVAKVKELTGGYSAHSVVEAVGTQESMMQAIQSARPGGHVGYVGVSHGVQLPGEFLFYSGVHLHGGPAPVREYLPELIQLIWDRKIDPGKVFDLAVSLDDIAEGYKAMAERRAIKAIVRP